MCGWRTQRSAWSSKAANVVVGRVRLSIAIWHVKLRSAVGWRSGRHRDRNEDRGVLDEAGAMWERLLALRSIQVFQDDLHSGLRPVWGKFTVGAAVVCPI